MINSLIYLIKAKRSLIQSSKLPWLDSLFSGGALTVAPVLHCLRQAEVGRIRGIYLFHLHLAAGRRADDLLGGDTLLLVILGEHVLHGRVGPTCWLLLAPSVSGTPRCTCRVARELTATALVLFDHTDELLL